MVTLVNNRLNRKSFQVKTKAMIATIVNGRTGPLTVNGKTYNGKMPTWSGQLSNADIAAVAERYGQILVTEGMFRDLPALAAFAAELRSLQANPGDAPLLWKHGLGSAMRSEALRLAEIRNWLEAEVRPRAGSAKC